MKALVLCLALVLLSAGSAAIDFDISWGHYSVNDINQVYVFDLDGDRLPEIYACSYGVRSMLYVFDSHGGLSYDILVPRPGLTDFGSEDITYIRPADLAGDGILDVLSGTQIISSGINSHRLYRLERLYEHDLDRYRTSMDWYYPRVGFITGVIPLDDGHVYVSSMDGYVNELDMEGNLLANASFGGSVFDMQAVNLGPNRTGFVIGAFRGLFVIDRNLSIILNKSFDDRVSRVLATDLENDSGFDMLALSGDFLYRLNLDGRALWKKQMRGVRTNIHAADFDLDGREDILVGVDDSIIALKPDGSDSWSLQLRGEANYITSYDFYNTSNLSLIVSLKKGLDVYDYGIFRNETQGALKSAGDMLVLAKEYYASGNKTAALDYASRARIIYSRIGENTLFMECDSLVKKIQLSISGDQYYDEASGYLESKEYIMALNSTQLSLESYMLAGFSEGIQEAVELNQSIYHRMHESGNISLGDFYYSQAESYYINSSFNIALDLAKNASLYYELAGYSVGIGKASILIASSSKNIKDSTTTLPEVPLTTTTLPQFNLNDYIDYVMALVFLLLVAVGFFAFRSLRK